MSLDDSKLLFVRLLTQHERRVYGYILRMVPVWSDADEVLQETNVRLWEEFDRFEPGTDFAAWAVRVAHYQVLTWRKRRSRSRLVFSDEAIQAIADESASQTSDADSRQTALADCLKTLSARKRDLILRCYAEGSTIRGVAGQVGRSAESVYKAVQRIRLALHQCVAQRLAAEEGA
jgi:RNA polymerase sigma-70 factor (ECF subfamily)